MHPTKMTNCSTIEPLEARKLLSSTFSGTIFNDANANGVRDAAEAPLKNQRVFIDTNFDGVWQSNEPSALTDAHGRYGFAGAAAGVYRLGLVSASGYRRTFPGTAFYDITATGFQNHPARDFGLTRTGLVRGVVFNDTNGDGKQQVSESGIANVLVYIDKNNNGKFDTGEKSRKTTASGTWRFNGLSASPATYVIRVVAPTGRVITAPAAKSYSFILKSGKTISHLDFGIL